MWRNRYLYSSVALLVALLATIAVFYPTLDKDTIYWAGGKNLSNLLSVSWLGLVLHLINVLAVYFFTLLVFRKPLVAVSLCLLWGLHPMHADTVAWIVRQNTLVSSIFYLFSLSFYMLYVRRQGEQKQWLFYGVSLALFGVAAYFQRYALIAPLTFFLLDFFEKRKLQQNTWIDKLPLLLFLALSWYFGMHSSQTPLSDETISLFQKLWLGGYALSVYVAKFFVPISLTLINPFSAALLSKFVLLWGAFVVFGLITLLIICIVRKKILLNEEFTFGLLFFLLHFLPSLILPLEGNLVWIAYKAYLPYLGLFYALIGLYYFFVRQSKLVVSIILTLVLALPLGYLSWQRSTLWKSTTALLTEVIEKYPKDGLAYYLRGNIYLRNKMYEAAFADLDKANLLQPEPMTTFLLAHAIHKLKDYKTSITAYERAVSMQPNLASTFRYNIDMAVNNTFNYDAPKARELFKQAEFMANDSLLKAEYHLGYGLYLTVYVEYDKAVQNYEQAIRLNPYLADAYANIGTIKLYINKVDEAISYLKRAEVLLPNDKIVMGNLANCYASKKDTVTANYYTQKYNIIVANEKKY